MLLTDQFLGSIFSKALTYEKYLTTGNEEQQQRCRHVHDAVSLNAKQTLQDWLDEVEQHPVDAAAEHPPASEIRRLMLTVPTDKFLTGDTNEECISKNVSEWD